MTGVLLEGEVWTQTHMRDNGVKKHWRGGGRPCDKSDASVSQGMSRMVGRHQKPQEAGRDSPLEPSESSAMLTP